MKITQNPTAAYLDNISLGARAHLRQELEWYYRYLQHPSQRTFFYISEIADCLTTYNELVDVPWFFKLQDFRPIY